MITRLLKRRTPLAEKEKERRHGATETRRADRSARDARAAYRLRYGDRCTVRRGALRDTLPLCRNLDERSNS